MPRLKNVRHEAFAQAHALGMSASDAYRATYGTNAKDISTLAWRLSVKVGKRVQEIQSHSEHVTHMTIEEKRSIYAKEGRDARNKLKDRLTAIKDDSELARHIQVSSGSSPALNVTVNVVSLTEERRADLMAKKRKAIEWQLAQRKMLDSEHATSRNGTNGTHRE